MLSRLIRTARLTTRSPSLTMPSSHTSPTSFSSAAGGTAGGPPAGNSEGQEQENTSTTTNPLERALPAPEQGTTTLDVSGDGSTVKLDRLGPLVVNADGTMSRIGNWAEMSAIEKENTLRILGQRNKQRMEALKKEKGEGC